MKFSWNVDVKQNWMLLFGKKIKNDKFPKNRFVYFAWKFHEINSSYSSSDLISHPFNILVIPPQVETCDLGHLYVWKHISLNPKWGILRRVWESNSRGKNDINFLRAWTFHEKIFLDFFGIMVGMFRKNSFMNISCNQNSPNIIIMKISWMPKIHIPNLIHEMFLQMVTINTPMKQK